MPQSQKTKFQANRDFGSIRPKMYSKNQKKDQKFGLAATPIEEVLEVDENFRQTQTSIDVNGQYRLVLKHIDLISGM